MPSANRLIILAGPSAAGKTTLIQAIRRGHIPAPCKQVLGDITEAFEYRSIRELIAEDPPFPSQMLLHYDFLHQYCPTRGFRHIGEVCRHYQSTSAVTLQVSADVLATRLSNRFKKTLGSMLYRPAPHRLRRLISMRGRLAIYRNPGRLARLYSEWTLFVSKCGIREHVILDPTDEAGDIQAVTAEAQ